MADDGAELLTLEKTPQGGWTHKGRLLRHVLVMRDGSIELVAADAPVETLSLGEAKALKTAAAINDGLAGVLANIAAVRAMSSAPSVVAPSVAAADGDDPPEPHTLH
ncbi:MAG: hypothetical protein ACHQAY_06760 [Hyphomicrobiales bacterium]